MDDISFELKLPYSLCPNQSYDWLETVSALRGFALYEDGHRPFFKKNHDQFLDQDSFEYQSYHIIAYYKNKLAGCIRLLPLIDNLDCVTSEIIGPEHFQQALEILPFKPETLSEGNRWIVHPDYKNTKTGYYLVYALWCLANYLGYRFIGNGGFKMNALIHHYGGVLLPTYGGPYYSQKYNDHVYIFYFDSNQLSERANAQIQQVSALLALEKVLSPNITGQKIPSSSCLTL